MQLAKGKHPAAPAFELSRLDASGGKLSLADLKGKPVIVNFWASWCIPCKDEAPALQKTYEKYRAQGLTVLGIDAQDFRAGRQALHQALRRHLPRRLRRLGLDARQVGRDGLPRDVLRRPLRPSRRRADPGRHRHRAQQGGLRQGHSGRTRPGAVIRLLAAGSRSARARRLGSRGCHGRDPPRQADLEAEIVCPTCKTTLDQSSSPIATRMKAFIRARIAAGDSAAQIKASSSTSSARPCSPSRRSAASTCSPGSSRSRRSASASSSSARSRGRGAAGATAVTTRRSDELDPDLERRVDEELARYED